MASATWAGAVRSALCPWPRRVTRLARGRTRSSASSRSRKPGEAFEHGLDVIVAGTEAVLRTVQVPPRGMVGEWSG
jgi:hypothetical protein